jgi:hypothetical protein
MKIKQFEWMKVSDGVPKACRGLMDMLPGRSIVGGWLVDILKSAMEQPIIYPLSKPSILLQFVGKVSLQKLDHVFNVMRESCIPLIMFYHSDDSVLRVNCKLGVLYMNLDIASCDGSHFEAVFLALNYLLSTPRTALLVRQMLNALKAPLKFVGDRMKFKLYPKQHLLYTGSILTTVTNNVGVIFIFSAIYERYGAISQCDTVEQVQQIIIDCAFQCGYILTIGSCTTNYHSLQFLKHSPNSENKAFINLSVLLRSLGYIRDQYPEESKACYFNIQREIILCYVHYTANPILDCLRKRYHIVDGERSARVSESYILNEINEHSTNDVEPRTFDVEDICRRYNVQPHSVTELCTYIETALEQSMVCTTLTHRLFEMDYEYDFEVPV